MRRGAPLAKLWKRRSSVNLEASGRALGNEVPDVCLARYQESHDELSGGIATLEPDDLGWNPAQQTHFRKVGILGDDRESVAFGQLPKGCIIGVFQAEPMDLGGAWKDRIEPRKQPVGEVLIEKQLHAA